MNAKISPVNGCLVVYKPKGFSSHDIIKIVRKNYFCNCGHSGTLDPMAQGVLLLFFGKALKLLNFLTPQELDKTYLMKLRLGITTDSYDSTGKLTSQYNKKIDITPELLCETLQKYTGTYEQCPPAFSAIKVNGKRAYKMAREGLTPELKPRPVTVSSIEMLADLHKSQIPELLLRVTCSRGTYMRSLAHDIGNSLGCGANLSYLLRERLGKWSYKNAFPLWKIENGIDFKKSVSFTDFSDILTYPKIIINSESEMCVNNGQSIALKALPNLPNTFGQDTITTKLQLFSVSGDLLGIYELRETSPDFKLFPLRVFK